MSENTYLSKSSARAYDVICTDPLNTTQRDLPNIVIAADWSVDGRKGWMVRADLCPKNKYLVFPPEPVGEHSTLIHRIETCLPEHGTALLGFDFPIGLPKQYAEKTGISTWRQGLELFGGPGWEYFYQRSDNPTLRQPFFPLPTREKGNYRNQLAEALGFGNLKQLLRRCDKKTDNRPGAECVFYTLGGRQVGAGAVIGWSEVLAPAMERIRFWPFDGDLNDLLREPGIVVVEVYPREAYTHLGISIGPGTGLSKRRREDRQKACAHVLEAVTGGGIKFSEPAKSWIQWGFEREDDFDAMMGLLSMLQVVTGQRDPGSPDEDPYIRTIEGWILGQYSAV